MVQETVNHLLLTPRELKGEAFASKQGRQADIKKSRRRLKCDMPGYTGHIRGYSAGYHWTHFYGRFPDDHKAGGWPRKHRDLPLATADNMYRKGSARIKTNSKNFSSFVFGDERDRFWETSYQGEFTEPEGSVSLEKESINLGWEDMEPEERNALYTRAYNFVGAEGTAELEKAIRSKIEQRTSGGPFALRKAFKYFDRDGSGDIDPDEFKEAMLFFGLTFTDRQVMSLFGTYDDDDSGALDYYEFIDKVIESDYKDPTGKKMSVRPKTPPRRTYPKQLELYRQMLRLKEMFKFSDEDETHGLGPEELTQFLIECGHKEPDEEQVEQIMAALDRDANGDVSFEELWDWWVGYKEDKEGQLGTSPQAGKTGVATSYETQVLRMADDEAKQGNYREAERLTKLANSIHADAGTCGDTGETGMPADSPHVLEGLTGDRGLKFPSSKQGSPGVSPELEEEGAQLHSIMGQSPRDLIKAARLRPPPINMGGSGGMHVPSPPSAPRTSRSAGIPLVGSPLRDVTMGTGSRKFKVRPTTGGNFYGNPTMSGQSYTPRCGGAMELHKNRAIISPRLPPQLRYGVMGNNPRGTTQQSGFRV